MGIEYFEFMDTLYSEVEDEIGKVVKQSDENCGFMKNNSEENFMVRGP